jgi:hypothetical protein
MVTHRNVRRGIKDDPDAQEECKGALDSLKKAMGAMIAIPGFVIPPSCQ